MISDANETKIEYLFLLEELFKKADLINIYSKFLSDRIEEIGVEKLPEKYKEVALAKIVSDEELLLGKIKYNDKVIHQSKVLRYFVDGGDKTKIQKDIRKSFVLLRDLQNKINKELGQNRLIHLSMGMTGDYEIGVEEGSTMIRVGTGLFGQRVF